MILCWIGFCKFFLLSFLLTEPAPFLILFLSLLIVLDFDNLFDVDAIFDIDSSSEEETSSVLLDASLSFADFSCCISYSQYQNLYLFYSFLY